jgi:TRAP-type mannitol/chloroaromatic compound transport system substrate-binding protein
MLRCGGQGRGRGCWTTAGFHTGKYPAVAFFSTVPFGPLYGEFFAWKIYGGGDALQNEISGEHGMTKIDCNATGSETSGWFREKIGSLEDLKGLKMRFFGLGAQVMQKLGVSTQLLAPPDIYPALERGVIDATEFAMPDMDINLGFYQVAKYNYYPGWHQPASVGELLMNRAAYEALPEPYKAMLEAACGWNIHVTFAESEAMNPPAMNEMLEKYEVQNVRWTDDELAAFEAAWNEVLAEQAAADPTFKKVADSYLAFREIYRTWGEAQRLEATYLSK